MEVYRKAREHFDRGRYATSRFLPRLTRPKSLEAIALPHYTGSACRAEETRLVLRAGPTVRILLLSVQRKVIDEGYRAVASTIAPVSTSISCRGVSCRGLCPHPVAAPKA